MLSLFRLNVTKMESRRDIQGLIKALGNRRKEVRNSAIQALVRIGDSISGHLFTALKEKNTNIREGAVIALGLLKNISAVEPLSESLKDEAYWIRIAAANALGNIGDPRALGALLMVPDYEMRNFVELGGNLGGGSPYRIKKWNHEVIFAAKSAACKIGCSSIEDLKDFLRDPVRRPYAEHVLEMIRNGK